MSSTSDLSHAASAGRFATTRWSVVLAARDHAAPALAELCQAYWYPHG